MRRIVLSSCSLLFLFACGQSDAGFELETLEQPIVNGVPSETADDGAVFVFTQIPDSDDAACTGVLIAPNLIATALHCVSYTPPVFCSSENPENCFSCNADGSIAADNPEAGAVGPLVPAANIQIRVGANASGPPSALGARVWGTGSNQICRNDFALVQLDRNLDMPLATLRLAAGAKWNETVHVVGYGETDDSSTMGRQARSGVRVIDVGPASDGEPMRTAPPRTFVVNEGPCHGDSGGPAFAESTGALLGVYSLTAGESCTGVGIRNVYTSIAPFSSLIMDAFTAAGAEPLLEDDGTADAPTTDADAGGCSLGATPAARQPGAGGVLLLGLVAAGVLTRRRRRSY